MTGRVPSGAQIHWGAAWLANHCQRSRISDLAGTSPLAAQFSAQNLRRISVMDDSEFSHEETEQRLEKILRGAFAGAPTPLKDIPTKEGAARAKRAKNDHPRKRRQRKKRAA